MPMFFIDVHDGRHTVIDETGIELADRHEAADEAAGLLPDFAREIIPNGQANNFAAVVRDASGDVIYRSLLLFRGQWSNCCHMEEDERPIDYELMRSSELRREALALKIRFANAIPGLVETLDQAKATLLASREARERRSGEA